MTDCNSISTPVDVNTKLTKETEDNKSETYMEHIPRRELVGSLVDLSNGKLFALES